MFILSKRALFASASKDAQGEQIILSGEVRKLLREPPVRVIFTHCVFV
jgi:hypothetical protein